VILVGRNIQGRTQTLATAALQRIDAEFRRRDRVRTDPARADPDHRGLLTMAQLRGVRAPMGRAS
jgi:hypothetical protein